jgi:hypothetical protein
MSDEELYTWLDAANGFEPVAQSAAKLDGLPPFEVEMTWRIRIWYRNY